MGFDNVDIKYCGKNNIPVSNVPDYGTEEVADSAICMMLMLLRKTFFLAEETTREGKWCGQKGMKGARRVRNMKVGIIGLGRIGTCFAIRAKAFGMKVSFYDPYVLHGFDKSLNIKRYSELDQILEESDVISIHCLLSEETKHLINKNNIKKMKKGAFLINTARGPIVEEEALVFALQNGILAGAGLDVLEVEPYKKNLKDCQNLILTPHSAFYSEEGFFEMRQKAAQELRRILEKNKPKYIINEKYLIKN